MGRNNKVFAVAFLAVGFGSPAVAVGQSNPIDRVSNPAAFNYSDVGIAPREMSEPFVRDGVVSEPQRFREITPGVAQAQVQTLLGAPIRQGGREWDYNFKFRMMQSENYLVCQYKVVFDENEVVRDTVWRRRQCQQIAESGAPKG